jgi:diacylglycerol kinase (ATP)
MRILLVHNIGAGDEGHDREWIADLIRQHGHAVEHLASDDWKTAVNDTFDLIVAAGGDGTVANVARFVAGGTIPMGVLPLGTANNVARSLGIADTPIPEIVASWAHAKPRLFDTGRAIGAQAFRFIESVGVGLLADGIAEITEGRAGYVDRLNASDERMDAAIDVLRHTLRNLEPVHVDLVLDGHRMPGDYLLVEVMTFGGAGPNLNLAPDADPADGLLDVVLVDERHRDRLVEELPRYRAGHRPPPPLPVHRASRVELTVGNRWVHLDDQLRNDEPHLVLTLEPLALSFLV